MIDGFGLSHLLKPLLHVGATVGHPCSFYMLFYFPTSILWSPTQLRLQKYICITHVCDGIATQLECPDLWRVHSQSTQGIRSSWKMTDIPDSVIQYILMRCDAFWWYVPGPCQDNYSHSDQSKVPGSRPPPHAPDVPLHDFDDPRELNVLDSGPFELVPMLDISPVIPSKLVGGCTRLPGRRMTSKSGRSFWQIHNIGLHMPAWGDIFPNTVLLGQDKSNSKDVSAYVWLATFSVM